MVGWKWLIAWFTNWKTQLCAPLPCEKQEGFWWLLSEKSLVSTIKAVSREIHILSWWHVAICLTQTEEGPDICLLIALLQIQFAVRWKLTSLSRDNETCFEGRAKRLSRFWHSNLTIVPWENRHFVKSRRDVLQVGSSFPINVFT